MAKSSSNLLKKKYLEMNDVDNSDYNYENLMKGVKASWMPMFDEIFKNEDGQKLFKFLQSQTMTIVPKPEHVFNAFKYFDLEDTKFVLLGQDPYINVETHDGEDIFQAMGLSFSVPSKLAIPPSLRNMYKEIKNSFSDWEVPKHGDLTKWVQNNNLLLLNSALTVQIFKSNTHQKYWTKFTDKVIEYISKHVDMVTFILLGGFAKKKRTLVDIHRHIIIQGTHPSPLSAHRGFFNSKIFEILNMRLEKVGKEPFKF